MRGWALQRFRRRARWRVRCPRRGQSLELQTQRSVYGWIVATASGIRLELDSRRRWAMRRRRKETQAQRHRGDWASSSIRHQGAESEVLEI
jgi:hypothetical protein